MDVRWKDSFTSLGLLILRLGIGGFMVIHGWGKVEMLQNGDFEKMGDPIGLGSQASLYLVTAAEFGCVLLVMIGFLTRLAAIPVVFAMGVAAFVAHANDPWTMGEGARLFFSKEAPFWFSKEPAILFLVPFLTLVFTGAGKFSIDGLLWPCCREPVDQNYR